MRLLPYSFGLLLAASLGAHAQQVSTASTSPHLYVGLAAYAGNYLPLGQLIGRGTTVPLQATVGYQLRPRWAVQASVGVNGRKTDFDGVLYETSAGGMPVPYSYTGQFQQRLFTSSVLARYTLTRPGAHRLQVDALAGLAWVHRRVSSTYTRTDTAGVATPSTGAYATNNLLLNAGLGFRYRLAPRLEATYDFLLGVPLAGYNLSGSHPSMALGLRYHVGQR